MKTYLLIHGAWGAAWEFDKVAELLATDESKVIAIDLPGHGNNKAEISAVTMTSYVETVVNAINKLDTQVILVGHSLAGAVISQAAEIVPQKIDRLIYVAAMLLANGDTPLNVMKNDAHGELLANTIFSTDGSYATLSESTVRNVLLNDVKDQHYLQRIVPKFLFKQASEPFTSPAQLTNENFGQVKKYYIKAAIDKVISPAAQEKMLDNWPVNKSFTLESGHFPLTSIPEQLAEVIKQTI